MHNRISRRGFTLVEMLIAVAIIGILAVLSIPRILYALETSRVARAVAEIRAFHEEIEVFRTTHVGGVPIDWSTFHKGSVPKDPWGNDYIFNSFNSTIAMPLVPLPILPAGVSNGLNTSLARRRNGSLAPINSKYDLFSEGADGDWLQFLIAAVSQDDVIMANDGGYIGLASDY
ncbi:MAG: prepilin-type N-terminal cleavage/methylation domain-containing protein [Candidatus Hydrogenedentota bacterium]